MISGQGVGWFLLIGGQLVGLRLEQVISARERALCQPTGCFEFQSRSERRKGLKSCALQMVFRSEVQS